MLRIIIVDTVAIVMEYDELVVNVGDDTVSTSGQVDQP
jgi:hypothetical protein